jgi:ribonuclease Z
MTNLLLSLSLILLGTGNPRPHPEHAGAATAILVGDEWFVVDAGRGVTMRIAATPLKYDAMRAVFITHLHSDHTAGLPDLFVTSWMFGRKTTPLQLYGPAGIGRLSDAMLQFFAYDIHIRRDLVERLPAAGATIRTHVVRQGVMYEDSNVRVTAFRVEHPPVEPAYGYRFDAAGKSIVISGDTRPNANLVRYARGADILVHEAYLPEWFDRVDTPEVAAKLKAYHSTPEEAGAMAASAGVKTLVLTHLVPAGQEDTFRQRAAKTFRGRLIVSRDLMSVSTSEEPNASDHP